MSVVIVTFRGGTDIYFVRQCINQRQGLTANAGIPIRGLVGESVPLERIASIETVIGPEWVTREWMERCVVVPCGVSGRDIGRFVALAQGVIDRQLELSGSGWSVARRAILPSRKRPRVASGQSS